MPCTRTITPVHHWPCIPRPADRVEQQAPSGRDRPDRVVAGIEHPPAPVRGLRDGSVAGTEPVVVGVEDRVALVAAPGPVQTMCAGDPHRVLAVGATAEVSGVEEVVPALAADHLRALDHAALPAA